MQSNFAFMTIISIVLSDTLLVKNIKNIKSTGKKDL